MSAPLTNAKLRVPEEGALGSPNAGQPQRIPSYYAPGREALQTLLAFSSLHDQIRRRRQRTSISPDRPGSVGPMERFGSDEVLQLISERALAITGTDGVAVALAEGDEVRCRAAAGEMAPDVGVRLDPNSGFSGACLRTGLIVRCDDTEKDPRVDQAACRRIGVRSIVAVPLLTEQGVVGLIAAFCRETHGVSDGDIRSLSLLAELALAALQPEEELPTSKRPVISDAGALRENEIAQPSSVAVDNLKLEIESTASPENGLPNLEALRNTLSLVTEERQAGTTVAEESAEPAASRVETPGKSRVWLAAILVLALLALALAGLTLWWWRSKSVVHHPTQAQANTSVGVPAAPSPHGDETTPTTSQDAKEAARQITSIRHWSSSDSSTVAIDLQGQVQYEAHRLSNPERIYFDLRDTTLAAGIPGNLEVGDALLSRIRIAQPTSDLTRVVLETKNNPNFSVKLETNPYRLLIEIRSATAKPKNSAKVNLFAPPNGVEEIQRANLSTPERGTWLAPDTMSAQTQRAVLPGAAHGLRIVLDAGHGGWDMGTVGRKGLLEKDLVLDIVARLGKLVTDRLGVEVIYTRRDDTYVALEKRTEIANISQADLFLSVHANYSDSPNARGVETYYTNTYSSARARVPDNGDPDALSVDWLNVDIREKVEQSRSFANNVQQALYHALAPRNPSLRNRGVKEASYVVLTGTTMPAILAEVSFVSSPEDETKLESSDYRQQIAEGLYKGIAAFSETQRRVNVASATPRSAGQ